MFDELFYQKIEKKKEKSKNRNVRNFEHRKSPFWGKSFWKKSRFFQFSTCYPSAKGRRGLKIKACGVICHANFDVRCFVSHLFEQ